MPVEVDSEAVSAISELAAPGTVLDGRFRLETLLGQGGMGFVYAAHHLGLEEQVAIKLLTPGKALDDTVRARLVREARTLAKVKSEHVVRVIDVLGHSSPPYLVMERLQGETLAERLQRVGVLSEQAAAAMLCEICEALGEAHRLGIVHRDLKPSNLFLCAKPAHPDFVKVLDFGISKICETDGEPLTETDALLGSPAYAPPEQLMASRAVDARADIWSLGVVLYRSLTGQLPFQGHTLAQTCTAILQDEPRPMRELRAELSASVEAAVSRCLRKDAAARFANVTELAHALAPSAPLAARRCLAYLDALAEPSVEREVTQAAQAMQAATDNPTLTSSAVLVSPSAVAAGPRARSGWTRWLWVPVVGLAGALGIWLGTRGQTPAATSIALPTQAPALSPAAGASAPGAPLVVVGAGAAPAAASAQTSTVPVIASSLTPEAQPRARPPAVKVRPSTKPSSSSGAAERAVEPMWVDSR